jgi:spermidine synthase
LELVNISSGLQKIQLTTEEEYGLSLFLDSALQFRESEEYRYHESLGIVPMLFCNPKKVFIGGGGDGLLAARLLRFDCIEEIIVCDYDQAVTDLACQQSDMLRLNEASLLNSKVKVLNEDAFVFLQTTPQKFDLILCDFPDPWFRPLDKLYSQEFYQLTHDHLSENGIIAVQTCMATDMAPVIRNTIRRVYPYESFFWIFSKAFIQSGFTLAAKKPFQKVRVVPEWARYLTDDVAEKLFVLPKDEQVYFQEHSNTISTLQNQQIAKIGIVHALRYGQSAIHEYRYNPEFQVFNVDKILRDVDDGDIELAIRYLNEKLKLIVYLDDVRYTKFGPLLEELGYQITKTYTKMRYPFNSTTAALWNGYWNKLNDGSAPRVEERYIAPNDDDETRFLIKEYLEKHPDYFYDVVDSEFPLFHKSTYLICRNSHGVAVVLVKFLDTEKESRTIEAEIIYGKGTNRENVLAILQVARHLRERQEESIYFYSPNRNLESVIRKIGGEVADTYRVYTQEETLNSASSSHG